MAAWHRQRWVLLRVSRSAWRLEQAERERSWALASARAEGISIRTLASAAGLSPARVHQITTAADMDELDAALGGLRAAGWPAPEDPGGDDDAELDGRDLICDRLLDEVGWLRRCAGWLTHLHTKGFPSAVNLRPVGDHPERAHVVADLPRVAAIAADVDELARARRMPTWTPRRCWVTGVPNDGARQQNRTWTSGSSAAVTGCPSPSAPGTCSPLSATSAAKPTSRRIRRPTRSGTTSRDRTYDPCRCQRCSANWTA